MKINVISDLHCAYDFKSKNVLWNRPSYTKYNLGTKKEDIVSDDDVVNEYRNNALVIANDLKDDIIKNCNLFINFKPRCGNEFYVNKYKCSSYNQCLQYLDKVIKSLKSNTHLKSRNMFDMCRCIDDFVYQVYTPKHTLHTAEYVFLRRFCDFNPKYLKPADYLIVAGDLGLDASYKEVYKDLKEKTKHLFKDVFFIKGNHDYWCFYDDPQFRTDINLEDRFFEKEIDDYLFLGCTMWAPVKKDSHEEFNVQHGMNDYRYIPNFTVDKVNELYNVESNWLRSKVQSNPNKKIIIFTHHNPIQELIDDDYKHSDVNAAYAVLDHSCDDIKPLVWICGHSHSYKDITKDGVRYIRNTIGYRESYGYLPSEVDPKHWYDTVIEV